MKSSIAVDELMTSGTRLARAAARRSPCATPSRAWAPDRRGPAACCWTVLSGRPPIHRVPLLHAPFAAAAAAASGVKAGLSARGDDKTTVMAWAGDGGTYDIGIQALSGAADRNEDIIYCCYDNEAYMNTGIQRSGGTPPGAWTMTTPGAGGSERPNKDLDAIMEAHSIPYIATATPAYPEDMVRKFDKAKAIKGFRFIHVLSPCPPGWK